jgi:hypothetical protein
VAFISGGKINRATGGTISTIGGHILHTFNTVGLNTFIPTTDGTIEVLVVGGGAAGSAQTGGSGGGGGGSVLYQKLIKVNAGVAYTMNVGAGGTNGNLGTDSVINLPNQIITALAGDVGIGSFGKTIFSSVPSSINEGASGTFNVTTDKIPNGTTLYWTINNGTTLDNDFDAISGSFTINNNTGSFSVPIATNLFIEGAETFTVSVRGIGISGNVLATSSTVTIPAKSYTFSSVPSTINEGASGTFNVTTTNVTNGTTLFWTVEHGTTNSADFGATSGSFTINSNSGTFSIPIATNLFVEGAETFTVKIRYLSITGEVVATSSTVTIPTKTYTFSSVPSSIDEGASGTFNFTTSNVTSGTTLFWTIDNISTVDSDFIATSGSFTINNNAGTFNVSIATDALVDAAETFRVQARYQSIGGQIVASSSIVAINNTTLTTVVSKNTVEEGQSVTFTTNATEFPNGTTLYYDIIGSAGITSTDFTSNSLSGIYTVSSGFASTTLTLVDDGITDQETFQLGVKTSAGGPILTYSPIVTTLDVLYPFTSFNFSSAGIAGTAGPSLATLKTFYNTSSFPWIDNTNYFNSTDGIQLWTVPVTGTYRIIAAGARGGATETNGSFGRGAIMQGDFSLVINQKIKIAVGQTTGLIGSGGAGFFGAGGGGGGTFVVRNTVGAATTSDILVIAGGGGSANSFGPSQPQFTNATLSDPANSSASWPSFVSDGNGGSGGNGGGPSGGGGGCGGGFLTDGNGGQVFGGNGIWGKSFLNGLAGGPAPGFGAAGSFGGGGSIRQPGGGGGGFSGGGGGGQASSGSSGGGGSSLNNGSNQINFIGNGDVGFLNGTGFVSITKL